MALNVKFTFEGDSSGRWRFKQMPYPLKSLHPTSNVVTSYMYGGLNARRHRATDKFELKRNPTRQFLQMLHWYESRLMYPSTYLFISSCSFLIDVQFNRFFLRKPDSRGVPFPPHICFYVVKEIVSIRPSLQLTTRFELVVGVNDKL